MISHSSCLSGGWEGKGCGARPPWDLESASWGYDGGTLFPVPESWSVGRAAVPSGVWAVRVTWSAGASRAVSQFSVSLLLALSSVRQGGAIQGAQRCM